MLLDCIAIIKMRQSALQRYSNNGVSTKFFSKVYYISNTECEPIAPISLIVYQKQI